MIIILDEITTKVIRKNGASGRIKTKPRMGRNNY
jgi:hypothetical protein